jgi:hypothetical protein
MRSCAAAAIAPTRDDCFVAEALARRAPAGAENQSRTTAIIGPLACPPTIDRAGLSLGTRHNLRKRASTYDEC